MAVDKQCLRDIEDEQGWARIVDRLIVRQKMEEIYQLNWCTPEFEVNQAFDCLVV